MDPLTSSADVTRTCGRTARNPRTATGSCRPRERRRGIVDRGAVDAERDPAPVAEAIDPGPLAQGALDVVPSPRIEQLLELRVVSRPPELAAGEDLWLSARLASGACLSGPRTTSLVIRTGMSCPASSFPRIGIRSPTHPWASWHSIDDIHVPPAPPSGPIACRRMPEFRTNLPPSVRLPHLYSTIR